MKPGMHRLTPLAPLFSMLLCACPEGSGPDTTPPDTTPPTPLQVAGSYDSAGLWNLSSAITEHPGPGTVVADLVVEQVVSLAGVPSFLEDEAREKVAAVLRAPIRDYVDGRVPDELVPGSALLNELEQIFASVEVDSRIELAGDDRDGLTGTETITALRLRHGERSILVPADAIRRGDASVPVAASIDARMSTASTLALEPHDFELRIHELLLRAGAELLEVVDPGSLGEQLASSFTCARVVEEITGGSVAFEFGAGGMTFSLNMEDLLEGCSLARDELVVRALGFIDPDIGVAVGGTVRAMDTDGDAMTDLLASGADYSGLLTAVPLPTPTSFDASFAAARVGE